MNTKENINAFFGNQNWDTETPHPGHEERFLKKLRKSKTKKKKCLVAIFNCGFPPIVFWIVCTL